MTMRIGVLLPRSTDHPAMGFDLLDGLRLRLKYEGLDDVRTIPENIGFGEDKKNVYAKAEKLLIQDEADVVLAYLSPQNAEQLGPLFEATGKSLVVIDPGMNHPTESNRNNVLTLSFQGIHASYLSGKKAGANGSPVIMATSFYDGGYRGPWAYVRGIESVGGRISGNFIAHHKEADFTVKPFMDLVQDGGRVAACFSTFQATMFVNALHREQDVLPALEFYCSSYMMEEQTMATYRLPGGKYYSYMPWISALDNEQNRAFVQEISDKKNKQANIFHLFGWEAGIVAAELSRRPDGVSAPVADVLKGWTYESPRGTVHIHPETNHTYAPLYYVEIQPVPEAGPLMTIRETAEVEADEHVRMLKEQPTGIVSGWVNHYLCT